MSSERPSPAWSISRLHDMDSVLVTRHAASAGGDLRAVPRRAEAPASTLATIPVTSTLVGMR